MIVILNKNPNSKQFSNISLNKGTTRANTKTGDAIYDLANKGLEFLDTRTEFWRQQKPIYARQISSGIRRQLDNQSLKVILKQLENIDARKKYQPDEILQ